MSVNAKKVEKLFKKFQGDHGKNVNPPKNRYPQHGGVRGG